MKVDVINLAGDKVSEIELNPSIFAAEVRSDILARVVKWQLAKRRSGNHKAKTRAEVKHTTRKPFKQKGTGRARQGMTSVSQMRGGGVVFGPVTRDHGHKLPKKVRVLGLKSALSAKVKDNSFVVIENFALDNLKTSQALQIVKKLDLTSALFVSDNKEENLTKAVSNIVGVNTIPQIGLNVYDILKHNKLVFSVEGINKLVERLNVSNK